MIYYYEVDEAQMGRIAWKTDLDASEVVEALKTLYVDRLLYIYRIIPDHRGYERKLFLYKHS
ncbi:MAG: hypothetical protein DRN26_00050 [Thermoplasmata archaeon]|nr:MAG: hypothetical protein DRN26_00050 [Thermoplasmata archaeon]